MSKKKEFELPEAVVKSTGLSPRDLVVIAQPKMGKSAIFGDFTTKYNGVVLNLEKGGYEYIDARKINIHESQEASDVDAFFNYCKIRNVLLKNKGKYSVLFIDGLSDLDKMSELGGTLAYMKSTVGKRFNAINPRDPSDKPEQFSPTDPGFKSVLTLPDGAGYKHTRDWFLDQIGMFREISPYRVYAAHIADKYISDKTRDAVVGQEILLTGKLKNIFASKVTALGKLIAENNERYLNFEVLNDSLIAGSRAPFLKGKILISKSEDKDTVKTFWENIFNKDLLNSIK